MSSDKDIKRSVAEVVSLVTSNTAVLGSLKDNDATIIELLNSIHQRVEDMSKKFDEVLNIGLKKPRVVSKTSKPAIKSTESKTKSPPKKKANVATTNLDVSTIIKVQDKPIKNVMTYFKTKYQEDDTLFNDILEENQSEAVFEQHKSDIASKKEGAPRKKTKATLLYKTLSKSQKSKIRERMVNEHERSIINNNDELAEESE